MNITTSMFLIFGCVIAANPAQAQIVPCPPTCDLVPNVTHFHESRVALPALSPPNGDRISPVFDRVPIGHTMRWVNQTPIAHQLVSDDAAYDTGMLAPPPDTLHEGGAACAVLNPPLPSSGGTYIRMTCALHPGSDERQVIFVYDPAIVSVDGARSPTTLAAASAWPNPALRFALIHYQIPDPGGIAELSICDVSGRIVRRLVQGFSAAGAKECRWDGLDALGRPAEPGVFFAQLRFAGEVRSKAIVLLAR